MVDCIDMNSARRVVDVDHPTENSLNLEYGVGQIVVKVW